MLEVDAGTTLAVRGNLTCFGMASYDDSEEMEHPHGTELPENLTPQESFVEVNHTSTVVSHVKFVIVDQCS